MRAFWALILVLVVGGVAAVLLSARNRPGAGGETLADRAQGLLPTEMPTTPMPAAVAPARPVVPDVQAMVATPGLGDAAMLDADLSRAIDAALPPAEPIAGKATTPGKDVGTPVELPIDAAHPVEKLVKARAVRRGDGALVLDERFTITGTGTEVDPFVVDFDLLTSAENTFQPRKGLTKLPQRVAFLHGAWVQITGYTAFPISASDPKELLVMFNQWDGCCIGVPPTPYDAVEVKLAASVSGKERFATHGTVVGRFKVDPYVDSDYLLGLYVLEDARLSSDKIDTKLQQQHNQP